MLDSHVSAHMERCPPHACCNGMPAAQAHDAPCAHTYAVCASLKCSHCDATGGCHANTAAPAGTHASCQVSVACKSSQLLCNIYTHTAADILGFHWRARSTNQAVTDTLCSKACDAARCACSSGVQQRHARVRALWRAWRPLLSTRATKLTGRQPILSLPGAARE